MDKVDEHNGNYTALDAATLPDTHKALIERLCGRFGTRGLLVAPIQRGRSTAHKWIIKPTSLFPFLLKIDSPERIQKEYAGDQLLRYRMSPLYMPPLEGAICEGAIGGLLYRYVTGGKLNEIINRMDVHFGEFRGVTHFGFLREIFDTALKKCHWRDGQPVLKPITLPPLPDPDSNAIPEGWSEIAAKYQHAVQVASHFLAPHGVIHGDLHPKNILFTRHHLPVLIDYEFVNEFGCVYEDFAKLEVHLQFQVSSKVNAPFDRVRTRVYSREPLIMPRSFESVAGSIHAIRDILWKNCLSRNVGLNAEQIDWGYRCQLLYYLTRTISRHGVSPRTREHAIEEFHELWAPLEHVEQSG